MLNIRKTILTTLSHFSIIQLPNNERGFHHGELLLHPQRTRLSCYL
nr:MAG TPA: hypothetical protein [Caudoviricetes sp.]